jgi:hypothetical protein
VSASNSGLSNARKKRKPYNAPTVTKLTPEEAKAALEATGLPDDEKVPKPVEAVKLRLGEKNA